MESIAQCLSFQKRSPLFRGKHNVHVDLNQGLRHGRADGETLSGFGAIDNPKPRVRVATLGFVVKRRCRFTQPEVCALRLKPEHSGRCPELIDWPDLLRGMANL
jgi:hypothetical protein